MGFLTKYSGASHNGPSHEWTISLLRTLAVAPIEITIGLMFNQPPTSGRFLIPDSGQAACSQLTNSVQQRLIADKQETTPIFHAGI